MEGRRLRLSPPHQSDSRDMNATSILVTVEQLWNMPNDGRRELIRGEIVPMNPSGSEQAAVIAEITGVLREHVRRNRLGVIFGA